MGFYGNITNTSKTQFQFDKIYSNRYTMEISKATDGIYAGRYVLVEYDSNISLDSLLRVQFVNGYAYYNPEGKVDDFSTLLTRSMINKGDIVYTAPVDKTMETGLLPKHCTFYICESEYLENSSLAAIFKEAAGMGLPNYTINYNIDVENYGPGRGYDSTVWQKTYMDGVEKYIMIAELNTVVPTFDVAADAPYMEPLVPHFDTQSTDIYYKLHWQPTWGFRIKEATASNATNKNNKNYATSTDTASYLSDEAAIGKVAFYNRETGVNDIVTKRYNGAIYYNKAGFDVEIHNYHDTKTGHQNEISILPTGQSGNEYNKHNGTSDTEVTQDIQEMKILLPVLGNTICSLWDSMYGYNPNDNKRYRDISWKDAYDIELDELNHNAQNNDIGGMTRDLNTIAGCINTVHDLMGMIITDKKNSYLDDDTWFNKNYIYKEDDKYYRIQRFPLYTTTTIGADTLPTRDQYPSDQQYNSAYEDVLNRILGVDEREYYLLTNPQVVDGYDSYIKYDAQCVNEKALSQYANTTITVGYLNGYYGYRFVEIETLAKSLDTIYGCILQMKNLLEVEDSETRDQSTVTGAINVLNDIIEVFEDLVPGEFLFADAQGHVNSANWTSAQVYSFTNFGKPSSVVDMPEYNNGTQENRWINLELKENERKFELTHNFNPIEDTTTTADKNDASGDEGINNTDDDTLVLYTPIVDATGHIVGKNLETVTLPYGFKTITTNGLLSSNDDDLYTTIINENSTTITATSTTDATDVLDIIADNTKDILNIETGNKWIQTMTDVNDDTLYIAHAIHAIDTVSEVSDMNGNGDEIIVQDTQYDRAGHVISNKKHTYTLPYSFKTIKTNGIVAEETSDIYTTSTGKDKNNASIADIVADNTQDEFTINTKNKWIQTTTDSGTDTLTIAHEIHYVNTDEVLTNLNIQLEEDPITSFTVCDIQQDAAGHITENKPHVYVLPHNYKFITIGNQSVNVANPETNTTTIIADQTQDELKFASSNRWIRMSASDNSNTVSIGHEVRPITNTPKDDTDLDNSQTFTIQDLTFDNAGHVTANQTHTYKLPDNFKYVDVGAASINTSAGTSTAGVIEANDQIATLNIKPENKWITLTANTSTDTVSIGHGAAGGAETTTYNQNDTPAFGATFGVPTITYDGMGHIVSVNNHTVQIPLPSLKNGEGNVVTGLSLTDTTGALTETKANIGTLGITGYTTDNIIADTLGSGDSLNTALAKLQLQVTKEVNDRSAAITQEVTDRNTAITKAIADLVFEDKDEKDGKYISSITQANGIINVSRTALPVDVLETGDTNGYIKFNGVEVAVAGLKSAAFTNSEDYAPSNILEETTFAYGIDELDNTFSRLTIAELFTVVAQLNAKIEELENKINTLTT